MCSEAFYEMGGAPKMSTTWQNLPDSNQFPIVELSNVPDMHAGYIAFL